MSKVCVAYSTWLTESSLVSQVNFVTTSQTNKLTSSDHPQ